MKTHNQPQLTVEELRLLKRFTVTWIAVYRIMPPEQILELFLFIHRLNKQLELLQKSVSNITITQASTVSDFHRQAVANIQHQRSMMR